MLSHQQARAFYDQLGKKQDWQSFYEDKATEVLIAHAAFGEASTVFEFGCGTGRLAERLLLHHLPPAAGYVAVDSSATMTALASERLARFGSRTEVHLTDGSLRLAFQSGAFDRLVAVYVLDLLSSEDIEEILGEAARLLSTGGLLCLVSLTFGFTPFSRLVTRLWQTVHAVQPLLVGGCRPLSLSEHLVGSRWRIRFQGKVSGYGVPSEVLVAEKRPMPA